MTASCETSKPVAKTSLSSRNYLWTRTWYSKCREALKWEQCRQLPPPSISPCFPSHTSLFVAPAHLASRARAEAVRAATISLTVSLRSSTILLRSKVLPTPPIFATTVLEALVSIQYVSRLTVRSAVPLASCQISLGIPIGSSRTTNYERMLVEWRCRRSSRKAPLSMPTLPMPVQCRDSSCSLRHWTFFSTRAFRYACHDSASTCCKSK